ncbi:hypothetical protein EG68_11938, partial [Paragonimus skrjabini miyazakii]
VAEFKECRRRPLCGLAIVCGKISKPIVLPRCELTTTPSMCPSEPQTSISESCCSCGQCVQSMDGIQLSAGLHHFDCLRCCICRKPLGRYTFREYAGKVYCAADFDSIVHRECLPLSPAVELNYGSPTCCTPCRSSLSTY